MPVDCIIDDAAVLRALVVRLGSMSTIEPDLDIRIFGEGGNLQTANASARFVSLNVEGQRNTNNGYAHAAEFQAVLMVSLSDQQPSIYAAASAVSAIRNCFEGHNMTDGQHNLQVQRIGTRAESAESGGIPEQSGNVVIYGYVTRASGATRLDAVQNILF